MRNQHIRDVLFLDINVEAEPPIAPKKPMAEVGALLERLYATNAHIRWSRDKTRKTYLRDFEYSRDDNALWLLLCETDAHAPGACFAHLETDAQRTEEKKEGEGRPETCHLLIKTIPSRDGVPKYLALLEEGSRFSRANVERYLRYLFRELFKANKDQFTYPSPAGERERDGSPKMIAYRNTLSVGGHPSEDFRRELETGTLRGISLETTESQNFGFGEGARLMPVRKQIKLGVEGSWKDNPTQIIAEALRMGRANRFEAAKIVFASSDDVSHTAVVDTENGNIFNDGYIKKMRVNADDLMLPEASETFHDALKARIQALLQ